MRCELSVGRTRHRPWTEPGGAAVGCRRRTPPSPLVGNADTYVLNVFILVLGILRFMYARSTVAERFPNVYKTFGNGNRSATQRVFFGLTTRLGRRV